MIGFLCFIDNGWECLELLEGLLVALRLRHLQRVELDRLGEGAALSDRHHVADLKMVGKGLFQFNLSDKYM